MLKAQGLGEYGALSGGGSSAVTDILRAIEDILRDTKPTTWLIVLALVLLVWFFFFRVRR
jgi:hypothetical protein